MSATLLIQLKPYFNDISEKLGYDIQSGDINEAHVLHQQSMETELVEIERGQKFQIDDQEYEYTIITSGKRYKPICNLEFETFTENFDSFSETIDLNSGEYLFHKDGVTIEFIKSLDYDYDDEL